MPVIAAIDLMVASVEEPIERAPKGATKELVTDLPVDGWRWPQARESRRGSVDF